MANIKEIIAKDLLPSMGKMSNKGKIWISFLILVILWGGYAFWIQLTQGHIVTGTRDHVVWGVYIVNFIFFIGLGYAGSMIAALLYLGKVGWRAPIVRVASIMMLISTIIGPIYILLEIGRLDRLHHLFLFGRVQSPIFWDVIAVMVYLIGCVLFVYLRIIRDCAFFSESKNFSDFRNKWYRRLSIGYSAQPEQNRLLKQSNDILAILIIPVAVIVSSILSWIFGMTLRPGWHSAIFGPYFVIAAFYSGLGVIVVLLYAYRSIYNLKAYIMDLHFKYMGYAIVVCGLIYGYLTFSEYFTEWYTLKEWDAHLIEKLFSWDHYGMWTFIANTGGILLPVLIIGIPMFRTPKSITFASALIVITMWIKRYLIVVPVLENTLLPMQELRPEYVNYSATWVEWSLIIASFAAFALLFTLIARLIGIIPVYTTSEIMEGSDNTTQTKLATS